LVVAGIALMRAYAFINSRIDALLMVVGGAVQLFFTYTKMSAISSKVNMNPTDLAIAGSLINIEWRYGLFVTIIGAIIIIVGGFMVFQEDSY
jgi:hypothetical protein